jgi:hypothetical protein
MGWKMQAYCHQPKVKKKKKLRKQWKPLPTLKKERSHFGTGYRTDPSTNKIGKYQWESGGIPAGLTWNQLLMTVDISAGKCASGTNKFGNMVDRMYLKHVS